MVEKKANVKEFVKELADKLDMRVVPKERPSVIPELPEGRKDFESMDSKKLSMELKDIDLELKRLQTQEDKVKQCVIKFMNDEKSDQYTKSVFQGDKFDERRMQIINRELTLLNNLRTYVNDLLKKALEKEMTQKFTAINTDLKNVVKDMSVKPTHLGDALIVEIDGRKKLPEKEQEESKPKPAATTSKSLGGVMD